MVNLSVSLYKNCAGKNNIWIDIEGTNGMRYQVNSMEDIKNSIQDYIEKYVIDKIAE